MANYPTNLYYSREHTWIRVDGARWRIGITEFASTRLGDIVFLELPMTGKAFVRDQACGNIESVKTVLDFLLPASGTIVAINEEVCEEPELVNSEPYDDGWLVEITPKDPAELKSLLNAKEYEELIRNE